jgi:hypothetical protein
MLDGNIMLYMLHVVESNTVLFMLTILVYNINNTVLLMLFVFAQVGWVWLYSVLV